MLFKISAFIPLCPAWALSARGVFPRGYVGKGGDPEQVCVLLGKERRGKDRTRNQVHSIPLEVLRGGIQGYAQPHVGTQRPVVASDTGWGIIS